MENNFNYTYELLEEFDKRIRHIDELVVIKFHVNEYMAKYFENHSMEKLQIVKVDLNSPDFYGVNSTVTAQFTSTNRPYSIGSEIYSGGRNANNSSLSNLFSSALSINSSVEKVTTYINANADRFRKHDDKVYELVLAFNNAHKTILERVRNFIIENKYVNAFSYDNSFINTDTDFDFSDALAGLNLYTYVKSQDNILDVITSNNRNYNSTYLGSMFMSGIMNYNNRRLNPTASTHAYITAFSDFDRFIRYGMVICAVPYTVRDDIKPEFFTKPNTDLKHLYIKTEEGYDSVAILSFLSNKKQQNELLYYMDMNLSNPLFYPYRCDITGHYRTSLDNQTFQHWYLNNVKDKTYSEAVYSISIHNLRPELNPVLHTIFSNLELTHRGCDFCYRDKGGFVYDGSVKDLLGFEPYSEEVFKQLLHKPSRASNEIHIGDQTYHACSICQPKLERQLDVYGGVFRGDFFLSEKSVTKPSDIVNPDYAFIQDYDYSPLIWDMSNNPDLPSLGVEIELDGDYDEDYDLEIHQIANMFQLILTKGNDNAYLMHDGSLNNGFECATMPASVIEHMDPTKFDYQQAFKSAIRTGMRAHDTGTAGIHVHISRDFFGTQRSKQLYRAALMAYIMESNWDDFVKFSRRRYHHLDQWAKKKDMKHRVDYDNYDTSDSFVEEYDHDKYVALNINHRNTFELRIFRSTLKYNTYIATLQFVSNLARLVKDIDLAQAQATTFKDIINVERYAELDQYIAERFGNDYLLEPENISENQRGNDLSA